MERAEDIETDMVINLFQRTTVYAVMISKQVLREKYSTKTQEESARVIL